MKIHAKCKYDQKAVRAMTHLWMFKEASPKKRMRIWTITYALLLLILVLQIMLIGPDTLLVVLTGVLLAVYALECYMYFWMPRRRYKAMGKLKDVENSYTFEKSAFTVVTKSAGQTGKDTVQYTNLVRAYETGKYFFFWRDKNQLYMVDKTTVSTDEVQSIRSLVRQHIPNNYVICKY